MKTIFKKCNKHVIVCRLTTVQSRAPVWDVQPKNRAGSLISWDSRTQHAIGWSVEAEVVDTGSEKRPRVRAQVTGTEWTAGVGDDSAESSVFFQKATITQPITASLVSRSTSGKAVLHFTLCFYKLQYLLFKTIVCVHFLKSILPFNWMLIRPCLAHGWFPAVAKVIVVLCQRTIW